MTTYETGSPAERTSEGTDLKERAVEAVAEVDAAAMHVAGVAGEEAGHVAREARRAASGFFAETRSQLTEQAATQQRRAAGALRETGDELSTMARDASGDSMAAGLVRRLGQNSSRAANWLDSREPGDLVDEARGFARRHTGAFLLIAIGVGIVAGRITRALIAGSETAAGDTAMASPGSMRARPVGESTSRAFPMGAGTPVADAVAAESGMSQAPGATAGEDEWSPTGSERP